MLFWTFLFLVIAILAAVFGFTNVAAESTGKAKVFFAIFFLMFLVSFAIQWLN